MNEIESISMGRPTAAPGAIHSSHARTSQLSSILKTGVFLLAVATLVAACLLLVQPMQADAAIKSTSGKIASAVDDSGYETAKATKKQLIAALNEVSSSSKIKGFNGGTFNSKSKAGKRLTKALNSLRKQGKTVGFVMIDLNTGKGISSSGTKTIYGASTIKGPYVVALNKWSQKSAKSVRGTIHNCIKYSDNDAYASLRSKYGSAPMKKMAKYCGIKNMNTTSYYIYNQPRNLAKLWVGNYWYFFKEKNSNSTWLRSQYKNTYMSFISSALSSTQTVYSKPGWGHFSGDTGLIHDDAAIVMDYGHPYILVIQSKALGHTKQLKELARALDGVHSEMVVS